MKTKKILLLTIELLCVAAIAVGVFLFQQKAEKQDAALVSEDEAARRFRPSISYQGAEYPLKRSISSLLLIGTDNSIYDVDQRDDLPYNYNQADLLVVLVFDHSAKTVTPFQICRDTMCDVRTTSGRVRQMQITLAHTYGSGKEDSCENTRLSVQNLLFGVPIDSYFAFTMDAVPLANDLAGGVTVTLEDDITALDPSYVKGARITLHGDEALRFVRYRDKSRVDGNFTRMAHHRLYVDAFIEAARAKAADDPDFTMRVFRKVERFLNTDLTVENVSKMLENLNEYELRPTVVPNGEYRMGEQYAEYYMDQDSLWDCVHTVFCD